MDVLEALGRFIDTSSPEPARFLTSMWDDQQKAITYKELKEAIRNGSLSLKYLDQWQQDYSRFIVESYGPMVDEAVSRSTAQLIADYGGHLNRPLQGAVDRYINSQGGRLIRNVSEGQYMAINTLVRQAALTNTLTVDELARCIRPCVGLTERQSQRCKKYYEQLREQGYSKKVALKKQQALAEKIHRERAALIAQTESAYAFHGGMAMAVQQNIDDGLISPDVEKEWVTADDEKVCDECGSLDGERVSKDENFSTWKPHPPAHPGCRCGMKYHLKPPERPPEARAAEQLPEAEGNGIISSEDDARGATFGIDGAGEYRHSVTEAVQECDTPAEIAWHFERPVEITAEDGTTETVMVSRVDIESFGKLSREAQKEAAEGIDWAMRTYRLDDLPQSIATRRMGGRTRGQYVDGKRQVFFRTGTPAETAFPTAVHEMTHYADEVMGYPAERIVEQARKNLKLRANSRRYSDLAYATAGKKWTDPHELLAYSMERYSVGMTNDFAAEIARLFLGGIV